MLGLDLTALIAGFIGGVVLWGGLSFLIDWASGLIKRRNTPDYESEIARLNGRVLELESQVQDIVSTAEHQIGELQSVNDALQSELAERAQDFENIEPLRARLAELEAQAAIADDMTARAETAEAALEDAKVTLLAAEKALMTIKDRADAHLKGNGAAPAHTPEPAPAPELATAQEPIAAQEPYAPQQAEYSAQEPLAQEEAVHEETEEPYALA